MGCSDVEMTTGALEPFCTTGELEIISDGQSCDIEANLFICEVLEIEETQFLDEEAYDWSPDICDFTLDDKIEFKHQGNSSFFNVVDLGHHIAQERILLGCNESYESITYVCQKNEVIYVSFLNDLLGEDTLTLELRTMTNSYKDQTPGAKRNIINFYQDKNNSNIRNFWINHFIGDDYYDQIWQSYNSQITLNGIVYRDVIKYEFGIHIHAEPEYKYYVQKGAGVIGFEVDGKLWLRE